jgi:hypothetical protein
MDKTLWSELPVRSTQKRRRDPEDYQVPIKLRNCQIGEDQYTTKDGFVVSEPEDSDSSFVDDTTDAEEEEEEEAITTEEEEDEVDELLQEAEVIKSRVERERVRRDVWFRKVIKVWKDWEGLETEFKICNSKPTGTLWGRHEPDYAMCVRHQDQEYYIYILESGALQCECEDFETMELMEMVNHLRKKKNGLSTSSEPICSGDQLTHATSHSSQ